MKHLLFLGAVFAAFYISQAASPDCYLPSDVGTGSSFIFSLFYNNETDQCDGFIYKGEGGNKNRFTNERECLRNCSRNIDRTYPLDEAVGKTRVKLSVSDTPPSEKKACYLRKAPGKCGSSVLRYYYDSIHSKCHTFFWTGCVGNGNRFVDAAKCNATCFGITDNGDEPEDVESDTPIAIICGVLLGIIVAAVIITVIVVSVKSKNKGTKTKAKGKRKETSTEAPIQVEME